MICANILFIGLEIYPQYFRSSGEFMSSFLHAWEDSLINNSHKKEIRCRNTLTQHCFDDVDEDDNKDLSHLNQNVL